jgi:hypothetical protein
MPEKPFHHPKGGQGSQKNPRQDVGKRVGLNDIVRYFTAINQIINSDEIEPGFEFVPEKPFRGKGEIKKIEKAEKEKIGDIPENFAVQNPVGDNQKKNRKNKAHIEIEGYIIHETNAKNI